MSKEEREHLDNTMAMYCHLQLALNHISCLKPNKTKTKQERYHINKLTELEKNINSVIKPINKTLQTNNSIELIDDMITEIHIAVDQIISNEI